jgi:hypothetical protein
MRRIKAILVTVLLASPTAAIAEPKQYLCLVDQSAGLHYDKQTNEWGPQAFRAGRKYVLRRLNDDDRKGKWKTELNNANWGFFEFGKADPTPYAACSDESLFTCREVVRKVEFDEKSLRFTIVNYLGYTQQGFWEYVRANNPDHFTRALSPKEAGDPDHPDDMFFEIGRCSAF